MGTNVIYLADLASAPATPAASSVPAYRRARLRLPAAAGAASVPSGRPAEGASPAAWVLAAQKRAALRVAATGATSAEGGYQALRVVNLPDMPSASGRIGRLRLSGRLIDVCAELERLAQAEAAADAMMRRA